MSQAIVILHQACWFEDFEPGEQLAWSDRLSIAKLCIMSVLHCLENVEYRIQ
jgi:hypothetical protein